MLDNCLEHFHEHFMYITFYSLQGCSIVLIFAEAEKRNNLLKEKLDKIKNEREIL